jgi:hypothetical protein
VTIPEVEFKRVASRVRNYWNPSLNNPHQGWFGMSRSGKSYAIRHGILPIAGNNSRIVVMDVKPGGERTWNGFGNDVAELPRGFGRGNDGTPHYHMLVDNKAQAQRFLEMIANDGSCIVVVDDARRITANAPDFGLGNYVDQLLTIGAAIGITVIICANSTTWATSSLRDQCGIYWVGQITNQDERKRITGYAGLPKEAIPLIGRMKPKHFLYSDRYDESGELRLAITHYPESR